MIADVKVREKFLPFAVPAIGEAEIEEVVDTLRSGWITTGPKVRRFEGDFAERVETSHAIAINSATAGLHIALTALGIGEGDEVIVPTMTFAASANVVIHLGGTPILVDVGDDFNVTAEIIEAAITPRTKAIMPVHFAGQTCDMVTIADVALRHNLHIVEDAAHVAGASYHGYAVGSDALTRYLLGENPSIKLITVFSFQAIKNMTTSEGGMITTNDDELNAEMRVWTLHGMSKDAWKRYTSAGSWYYEIVAPGYKNNMMDIQAALGIHQLASLDDNNYKRQMIVAQYNAAFADVPAIETPISHRDRTHVYHLYVIRLNLDELTIDRGQFIDELKRLNIGTGVHYIPVHLHPYYRDEWGYARGDLVSAETHFDRIISLPLYPTMSQNDVDDVIDAVTNVATIFGH